MENFYLDNAATTKVFDEEVALFKQLNDEYFYNPSASYIPARNTRKMYENARDEICKCLHGLGGKLYFTSSATESNNTVLNGVHFRKGDVILVSIGEHPSVYVTAHNLKIDGVSVVDIPFNSSGRVDEEKYLQLLKNNNVKLVSIIHSSNETGAVNDIEKLCAMAKNINKNILFHSDGVQAFGKINVNLDKLGVDFYTISAHKVYAPRGIAGLWVRSGALIDPFLMGGGQENGFRSSTENVFGAIMFAFACKKVCKELDENFNIVKNLKNEFIEKLKLSKIGEFVKINSEPENNPYVLSISIAGLKGEILMNSLELDGIYISTGSACSAKKAGNRILEAMGVDEKNVVGSVRISFSPYIKYDVEYIVSCFEKQILRFKR